MLSRGIQRPQPSTPDKSRNRTSAVLEPISLVTADLSEGVTEKMLRMQKTKVRRPEATLSKGDRLGETGSKSNATRTCVTASLFAFTLTIKRSSLSCER